MEDDDSLKGTIEGQEEVTEVGVGVRDDAMHVRLAVTQQCNTVCENQPPHKQQLLSPINMLVIDLQDRHGEFCYPACVSEIQEMMKLQRGTVPTTADHKNYFTNIVVLKGMAGKRKRKTRGMSGGWQAGVQESGRGSGRSPWR